MQYSVSVRTLCEFTAKRGDLDLRFTPSPSAQEGVAGHQCVTGRRGASYESEISLRGEFGPLLVRGRADGYDPALRRRSRVLQPAGSCHHCGNSDGIADRLFCDVDCADDWEYERRLRSRLGLPAAQALH